MDHAAAQDWLNRYIEAWPSYTVVTTGTSRYREMPGGPVVRTYKN